VRIELVEGDITRQAVDAVVNAANTSLMGGGGVDGAIHAAGGPEILAHCQRIRRESYPQGVPIGAAVATTGGRLPARWIIHTVGPVYRREVDQAHLLRSCYTSSLTVAESLGAEVVAFPLISAGIFGWPKEDAVAQALAALRAATTSVSIVRMVLFGQSTYDTAVRMVGSGPAVAAPPDGTTE
jgi:O-acetyl-ADP-ribose deacetylase (regulator of RNase III)